MTLRGAIEMTSTYVIAAVGTFIAWFAASDINIWIGVSSLILILLRVGVEMLNFVSAWRKVHGQKENSTDH